MPRALVSAVLKGILADCINVWEKDRKEGIPILSCLEDVVSSPSFVVLCQMVMTGSSTSPRSHFAEASVETRLLIGLYRALLTFGPTSRRSHGYRLFC